jgi:hypothetical protein
MYNDNALSRKDYIPCFLAQDKATGWANEVACSSYRDVCYAHYGLDIFVHDANYTVGSFAKLLRDLERPLKSSSRRLYDGSRSSPMFEAVLSGAEMCEAILPQLSRIPSAATPLPPILNVQMENTVGDNRNRFVFYF